MSPRVAMPFAKTSDAEFERIAQKVRDILRATDHPLAQPQHRPNQPRSLLDIERAADAIARRVAVDLTADALAELAEQAPERAPCPRCQQSWKVVRKKRVLITTHGPVEYLEPAAHCFACRSDFFSSAS